MTNRLNKIKKGIDATIEKATGNSIIGIAKRDIKANENIEIHISKNGSRMCEAIEFIY